MKKTKGFGLLGIIIIMIITSIVSGLATGVIMLNSTSKVKEVSDDKELQEFINVYETLLSRYYDNFDKKEVLKAAEEGMLNYLGDKYTTYLEDEEYQGILDDLSATYEGIGVEISNNLIVYVMPDSPAEKAGLKAEDLINKVNGITVTGLNSENISTLIRNDKSNNIALEVLRGEEILNFNLEKKSLTNKSVDYQVIENTSIGYLAITKFSEKLSEQVDLALKELESYNINSLIIDVRNNVGGYLDAAEKTSSLFLEEGKVIYSLENSNNTMILRDKTKEKREYPIVVLINENSASAAEILAAALNDSYNATIVGTQSYGKGKVQQVEPLETGGSIKLTTAKWLTPSGICIDGTGITPDYYIENDQLDIDSQLNKAIEILEN